jgi:hypothetical protein
MKTKQLIPVGCAVLASSVGAAQAGLGTLAANPQISATREPDPRRETPVRLTNH